jgi:cytochrome c oxidase subunit 2
MPGFVSGAAPVTNHTQLVTDFWVNSWIILLAIGFIAWGLMLWSMVVYRRRKTDTGLPVQLRYNMPIEILFTVIPLILIIGLFALTARDEEVIEQRFDNPDVTIQAFGKQWAWDFNYTDEDVYYSGIQVQPDLSEGAEQGSVLESSIPTLYLPVGKKVEIQLNARDVIHSFWVIDFLYKKDMIPGKTNYMSIVPEREGTYAGKCAELCGEFHSQMLFQVKVVSQEEYDAYIESLREQGFEGQLGTEYDRNKNQANVVASATESK